MERLLSFGASACVLVAMACGGDPARSGSSASVVSPSTSQRLAGGLPRARNFAPVVDAPTVALRGTDVLVDGRVVASTEQLLSSGGLKKLDGEYEALKSFREGFKARFPDKPFSGAVLLELDGSTRGAVLMSVFQTAVYAGFPNISFVVEPLEPQTGAGRVGIAIDAMIPGPPDDPVDTEPKLVVDASTPDKVVIGWLVGSDLLERAIVPADDGPAIANHITEQWKAKGRHRAPDDRRLDQAVLEIGLSTELSRLVTTLDALRTPQREQLIDGARSTGPVFNVSLGVPGWRAPRR